MIRDIGELAKLVQIFRTDGRVIINTCPAVETLPIRLENPVLDGLIEWGSGIRGCHGELDCKRIQFFCIADGILYPLNCVVRQPQRVVCNNPDSQFMTVFDDLFLLRVRYRLSPVYAQNIVV